MMPSWPQFRYAWCKAGGLAACELLARVGCRFQVRQVHPIPRGGVVVVSNHPTWLDPLWLVLAGRAVKREIRPWVASEWFRHHWMGAGLRLLGAVPMARNRIDHAAIRLAVERTRAGDCVAFFPQGHRGDTPWMPSNCKPGAVVVAGRGNVPLVPVTIFAGFDTRHHVRSPIWPRRLWVVIHEPISVRGDYDASSKTAATILEHVQSVINAPIAAWLREHRPDLFAADAFFGRPLPRLSWRRLPPAELVSD